MKKIFLLFVAVAGLITFQSCEGPQGPPGPPGGGGGSNEVAVYEVEANLNRNNNYEATFGFKPALLDADLVLVYRLDGVDNKIDVWRMLPQTYYIGSNEIDYNFDYTKLDFRVFLESTSTNPDAIDNGYWTNNQVFRAIVIEGYFGDTKRTASLTDETRLDYESIVKKYNIKESDVIRLN